MFLFTMFFRLIFLPFTLIGMAFGLLGISTKIFLLPLKIVVKNLKFFLIVGVVLGLYLALKREPQSLDTLKPAPGTPKEQGQRVEPVAKEEDGDSAFATDLYQTMSASERQYYSAIFYQVMGSSADGEPNNWAYYNIQGSIRPLNRFQNNVGDTCRKFTEVLKVHRIQQTLSGTACDNGGGSWCKLKPNATPACGLGHKADPLEGITGAVKNLF